MGGGASVRNHTESKMAKLLMLLLLPSLILADGPGGHHHGAHHGDHGAHHGAHNENHAHAGGAAHHGDHGASHHPVQHTLQSSPVQHHTVHRYFFEMIPDKISSKMNEFYKIQIKSQFCNSKKSSFITLT